MCEIELICDQLLLCIEYYSYASSRSPARSYGLGTRSSYSRKAVGRTVLKPYGVSRVRSVAVPVADEPSASEHSELQLSSSAFIRRAVAWVHVPVYARTQVVRA